VGGTYVDRELDIDVYPVTFTFKAILPYKKWEFFGLAGAGVYIVSGTYDVDDHHHHYDYDDDARLGGYLGAGIHYNLTRRIFVGVEGKYLWTDKAKLAFEEFGTPLRVKFKMDGILATAVIGFKF
jgi:opacity protein-like surface antigen